MSFMSPPVPEPVDAPALMPLWLLPDEPPMVEPLLASFEPPVEPAEPVALLVPLAVEPEALIAPIEPTPCEDDCDDDEPALLVPPTAPVLDAVAPPVLEPVEVLWSLPWFSWLLLFRLPELLELPWLPALFALLPELLPELLPFASLDF
jgi:hypothetical protein